MPTNGWRYMAQRFDGTGNLGDFVDLNLPLREIEIEEVLSGDNSLSATISPEFSGLIGSDGRPLFDEWGVCIWAESPAGQVFGGILESSGFDGPDWALECVDISGIFKDTPFDDAVAFQTVDPIDVFRYIWLWYQARPGCNFGVTTDSTTSPVRIGNILVQRQDFDTGAADPADLPDDEPAETAPTSYPNQDAWIDSAVRKLKGKQGWTGAQIRNALEKWLAQGRGSLNDNQKEIVKKAKRLAGKPPKTPPDDPPADPAPSITAAASQPLVYEIDPYRLNWYTNHDLSATLADLSEDTPFDWHLTHSWSDESDDADLFHHVRIGYPRLGRRLTDLRFVLGENIHEVPGVDRSGEDYANEIIVIGNGEGSAAVRGRAFRPVPGRVRRTKTIVDTTITTVESCNARAEAEIAARATLEEISSLIIIDHPHAPIGSVSLGDEFYLEGDTGWIDLNLWVRCIGRRFSPEDGSKMSLTVMRTDRLG